MKPRILFFIPIFITLLLFSSCKLSEEGEGRKMVMDDGEIIMEEDMAEEGGNSGDNTIRTGPGQLAVWGDNANWLLGIENEDSQMSPVPGPEGIWQQVAIGWLYTLAIQSDGTLWGWGDGVALGLGSDNIYYQSPIQLGEESDWSHVSSIWTHTIALKNDGALWAWGENSDGQLGLGDTTYRYEATQVGSETNWAIIATGSDHTVALKNDGTLWAWGGNTSGQLGLTDVSMDTCDFYSCITLPTQVGDQTHWSAIAASVGRSIAIQKDGTLWMWGNDLHVITQVGVANNWQAVTLGGASYIGIQSDGSLWSWGGNSTGELGQGDTTYRYFPGQVGTDTNWSQIAMRNLQSLALKNDGTLWAWGNNSKGQLGLGDVSSDDCLVYSCIIIPTQIGNETYWDNIFVGINRSMAIHH